MTKIHQSIHIVTCRRKLCLDLVILHLFDIDIFRCKINLAYYSIYKIINRQTHKNYQCLSYILDDHFIQHSFHIFFLMMKLWARESLFNSKQKKHLWVQHSFSFNSKLKSWYGPNWPLSSCCSSLNPNWNLNKFMSSVCQQKTIFSSK